MSGDQNDEELEELRKERMEQLRDEQDSGEDQQAREQAQERADAQKTAILRQHLTDDARKRLNTVKMSKPQVGEQVESQVVSLAKSGRVQDRIDDDQMKDLLRKLTPDSKSFDIQHR